MSKRRARTRSFHRSARALTPGRIQTRSFTPEADTNDQALTTDLQAQLDHAQRFSYNLSPSQETNSAPSAPAERPSADRASAPESETVDLMALNRPTHLTQPLDPVLQAKLDWAAKMDAIQFGDYLAQPATPIQAKLTIGAVGDRYEQEADRVAQAVVQRLDETEEGRSPAGNTPSNPTVQREAMPEEDELQMTPDALQQETLPEEEDELQMMRSSKAIQRTEVKAEEDLQIMPVAQRHSEEGMAAPFDLETSIQRAKGGGQPLSNNIREPMEQAFRADFSGVKVHTDAHSDELNQSIQAKAFTTGQDVFFRQGAYDPSSSSGKELIAHELTHVVQQNGDSVRRVPQHSLPQQPATDPLPVSEVDHTIAQTDIQKNMIQRWNIRGNIDWNQTQSVEPLVSRPVMFFDDQAGDRIVVKGEDVSIGKTQLANMLHEQIHGTQVVYTRDITAHKATINSIIDQPNLSGAHANWAQIHAKFPNILPASFPNLANLTPDEKGRKSRQEHLNFLPRLQVMDFVPGRSAEALSQVGGNTGGYQTMRQLLMNRAYVERLGKITAVDLFLENDDRVLAGNLGNWMHDQAGNITLIDQLNNNAMALLDDTSNPVGPTTNLDELAPNRIQQTAATCINALLHSMFAAGDQTVQAWANQQVGAQARKATIEAHFLTGMRRGVKDLIKHLKTNKMRQKGRGIKGGSGLYENLDTHSGNAPGHPFWERLKARARYLANL